MSNHGWASTLLDKLTPNIIAGYNSILKESLSLCKNNGESDKYLMTFQNLISSIPKWNSTIIENERKRITKKSQCNNLEDIISCFHIIQLKHLTAMRAATKQQKIDINIPKIDDFIHRVYINTARKIYQNVYLFERNIPPLQIQKNNRELELIINDAILYTIRENIPYDEILKAYLEETLEEDVTEEVTKEVVEEKVKPKELPKPIPSLQKDTQNKTEKELEKEKENIYRKETITEEIKEDKIEEKEKDNISLSFNDNDFVKNENNVEEIIVAPKTIERLEEVSVQRNETRKLEEAEADNSDDEDDDKIKIHNDDNISTKLDIESLDAIDLNFDKLE